MQCQTTPRAVTIARDNLFFDVRVPETTQILFVNEQIHASRKKLASIYAQWRDHPAPRNRARMRRPAAIADCKPQAIGFFNPDLQVYQKRL
jgi:hypothetical protein